MGSYFSRLGSGSDKVVPTSPPDSAKGGSPGVEGGINPMARSRSCTDILWLILLVLFLVPLGALLIYCIRYGDIYRVFNGYDRCGNVCGRITERVGIAPNDPRFTCLGADMTKRKYLLVRGAGTRDGNSEINVNRECVASCSAQGVNFRQFLNRCIPVRNQEQVETYFSKTGLQNFFQEVSEDMDLCWREILGLFFISILFAVVLLLLLRFAVRFVVWAVLILVLIVCLIATAYLWSKWAKERDNLKDAYRYKPLMKESQVEMVNIDSYLGYAIAASIITLILLLLVIVLRKRIGLVVRLFEEAGKAIIDIPTLLIQPWVTLIMVGALIALWFYFALWIESSGILTSENNVNFNYKKDGAMKVTRWYNLLAMFWLTQFALAGQHMIVAGAVATWYFTRRKRDLDAPVAASTGRMLRYHLGSVSVGSLFVAIVQFARVIMQAMQSALHSDDGDESALKSQILKICQCCMCCFEKLIAYISRNAFIEVAMRGCSFFEGGARAFKIIGNNALRVATINSVGDFVLFLGKIAVTLSTMLVAIQLIQNKEGVQHMWVPITLAALFGYLVAHCFMSIYEMAIDTIFICFCEDCELNDGVTRPYYMSRSLMSAAGMKSIRFKAREKLRGPDFSFDEERKRQVEERQKMLDQVVKEYIDDRSPTHNGHVSTRPSSAMNGTNGHLNGTHTYPKGTAFTIDAQ